MFLSDPILLHPTPTTIQVVWFTSQPGILHYLMYGENLDQKSLVTTTQLSRTQEDQDSCWGSQLLNKPTPRLIWRHQAIATNLLPNTKIPYYVTSIDENETKYSSSIYTLSSQPLPGTQLKILLTSDHQLHHMISANLQKVVETIGEIDGIFFAGDMVNVSDRASEWFDDDRGCAFFPNLQGKANYKLNQVEYRGGELLQYAPIFPTIGNHEVMGMKLDDRSLVEQFKLARPLFTADRNKNIVDQTFNTITYQEIFGFPPYYAISFGDIRLISLFVTNVWRTYNRNAMVPGRYQESVLDLEFGDRWGYGQHIFESIQVGSNQYSWLEQELNKYEWKEAKYKIVMFHHPPHTLGDNIVPAYTDPIQIINRDETQKITSIEYHYPKDQDYIIKDLLPLLGSQVQLILFGHSHLWNRFKSEEGVNFLETSNVGNSYGAFLNQKRPVPDSPDYISTGDPNGLIPIIPNIAPLTDDLDQPLAYVASNDITVFSILDTESGTISSYRFNTRSPNDPVIKFDEFKL